MGAIKTPCIKVCVVEPGSTTCLGCARTLDEIARWTGYSDAERERIIAELPHRLEARRRRAAVPAS